MKVYAVFLGFQEIPDDQPIPLFNIMGNHPLEHSTVGLDTLKKLGIDVPAYPCLVEAVHV